MRDGLGRSVINLWIGFLDILSRAHTDSISLSVTIVCMGCGDTGSEHQTKPCEGALGARCNDPGRQRFDLLLGV